MYEIDKIKLNLYEKKFGRMSSDDAIHLAISVEQTIKDISPMDLAASMLHQQMIWFETYALLLEKAGK